jgi:hypothetical protein
MARKNASAPRKIYVRKNTFHVLVSGTHYGINCDDSRFDRDEIEGHELAVEVLARPGCPTAVVTTPDGRFEHWGARRTLAQAAK